MLTQHVIVITELMLIYVQGSAEPDEDGSP